MTVRTRQLGSETRGFSIGVLVLTTLLVGWGAQSGRAQELPLQKMDRHLLEKVEQVESGRAGDAPVNVIVTVKSGARRRLTEKLRAQGGRQKGDFAVISGGAAELRPSKLRELADDDDVVNISADADVHSSGVASTVSGAPLNTGFSLRSTLGLREVSSTSTTKTFQQSDAAGYAGTVDTDVLASHPTQARGSWSAMETDLDADPDDGYQYALVRFDNLFGSGANQIPTGSTITSATLTLQHYADGSSSATASLHQMLVDWDEQSTWNSMSVSGTGIQFDNVEARSAADAAVSNLAISGAKVFAGSALTAAVQAWANGAVNHGWVIKQSHDNGWIMRTSETYSVSNRPLLTITYRAPVTTTHLTGDGVTVALVDSGMLQDGGGSSRIKTTRDFTTGLASPPHTGPIDGYGHGTHIAGLIGGQRTDVQGIAPNVQFVSLRVLDDQGIGSTSHVINAIQWAIAHKTTYDIDVLNVSLGHPIYERAGQDPLVQAVEAAVRAGITVVVAAGNLGMNPRTGQIGYTGISSPGNAPSAITVGSSRTLNTTSRQDDLVSDFSSRGPTWFDAFQKPDLVAPGQYLLGPAAPGQSLYTALPVLRGPSYGGRAYMYMSGTSMAAGVVSGTVALMIEQSRSFGARASTNAIKAMLQRSAIPLSNAGGSRYDYLTQGAGTLNAHGAVQLAAALNPQAPDGWSWVYGDIPLATTIDGQLIAWGDDIVWGTTVLHGHALDTRLSAWNDNIVWGTTDNIVWGTSLPAYAEQDNIVWGTSTTWQDNVVWGSSDNIVWGTADDNIVWGTRDNLVGPSSDDNIVWGTHDDNIVWGTSALSTLAP